MSISTQIERIKQAKDIIRDKMIALGLATNTDTISQLAASLNTVTDQGTPAAEVHVGETYSILPGYYHGGTVAAVAGEDEYPLQEKGPITPTKLQQHITSDDGYYGLSGVTVDPIPGGYEYVGNVTATAAEVLANKVFVDAAGTEHAGTMLNNGKAAKTITGLNTDMSVTLGGGYYSGITVTLSSDIETQLAAI